jgi:hypothetical protein
MIITSCVLLSSSLAMGGEVEIRGVSHDLKNVYVTVAGNSLPSSYIAYMTSAPGTNMSYNHRIFDDGTHRDEITGNKVFTCALFDLNGSGNKGHRDAGTYASPTSVTLYDEDGVEVTTYDLNRNMWGSASR